ncbi:MAG: exopolyphosphatase [Candidatus Eremiobacteraeota bacterium]|nr:exopolyphosphatase [Candidatus Eremiobacteraeota bacterium]
MAEEKQKYRLVTRSDFDGLVCAVLLKELDMINDILFVHPKDVQDGKIRILSSDITTNLPYVESVYLAFDHHLSEIYRISGKKKNHIIEPDAPSTARVVYNYFGGKETFPEISGEMLEAVDKADWAQFTMDDILNPKGWELLNFIMDPRTGLGRFRNFNISNYKLMMNLIRYCKTHTIEEILQLSDVKERAELYFEHQKKIKEQLERCSTVHNNLLVVDLRYEEMIYSGNRFLKYAQFPECNISIQIIWGLRKQNIVFAVGKSIFNKTSKTNIGELMLKYGGGGHKNAGTCQIGNGKAEKVLNELIETITSEG